MPMIACVQAHSATHAACCCYCGTLRLRVHNAFACGPGFALSSHHPRVLSILGTSDFTWLPSTCAAFAASALTWRACRRKDVLPVINKRWARLLRGGSPAWRVAKITHTYIHTEDEDESEDESEEPLNSAAVLGWFNSRPG